MDCRKSSIFESFIVLITNKYLSSLEYLSPSLWIIHHGYAVSRKSVVADGTASKDDANLFSTVDGRHSTDKALFLCTSRETPSKWPSSEYWIAHKISSIPDLTHCSTLPFFLLSVKMVSPVWALLLLSPWLSVSVWSHQPCVTLFVWTRATVIARSFSLNPLVCGATPALSTGVATNTALFRKIKSWMTPLTLLVHWVWLPTFLGLSSGCFFSLPDAWSSLLLSLPWLLA